MLRTIAIAVLIGFVSAAATAQPAPSPSPSPARGTRAYTEEFYERYQKAQADYDAANADPNASLDALDAAHLKLRVIGQNALGALGDEADTYDDVKAAKQKHEDAEALYQKLKREGKDYAAELSAEAKASKAFREYLRIKGEVENKIEKAIGIRVADFDPPYTARHKALRDARAKAEADAEKKKAEPKKTSCAPGTGLAGITENLACQEQHSGSGH